MFEAKGCSYKVDDKVAIPNCWYVIIRIIAPHTFLLLSFDYLQMWSVLRSQIFTEILRALLFFFN